MPLDIVLADAAALGSQAGSLSGSVNRTKEVFEVPSFSPGSRGVRQGIGS